MDALDPIRIITIFLVFARVAAVMTAAPFFGHRSIPKKVRLLLALLLGYVMSGLVAAPAPESALTPLGLTIAFAAEILAGAAIGFTAQFVFWGISYAAYILGFQMGLAMAQVYNPADGSNTNPIGRLMLLLFLMMFILLEGPHHIIRAMAFSFEAIPLAGARTAAIGPVLLDFAGGLFITAVRLASPFMVTFFLLEVSLGIFARVVPQADLFSLSLPIKLLLGLGFGYLFMANLVPVLPALVDQMVQDLQTMLNSLAG